MKLVTAVVHFTVDDAQEPEEFLDGVFSLAKENGLHTALRISAAHERPLEAGMVIDIEFDVDAYMYDCEPRWRRGDADILRIALTDRANPDTTRSARRWARIMELEAAWKAGWAASDDTNKKVKSKNRVCFSDTDEGQAVCRELCQLRDIERMAASLLNWPIWQGGQHTEVLVDGVLYDCSVQSFDTDKRTVDVSMWMADDVVASLRGGNPVHTVTIEQIEAGIAMKKALQQQRQAAVDAAKAAAPTKEKKSKRDAQRQAPVEQADLFSCIPSAD
jgi:hypothetical protein